MEKYKNSMLNCLQFLPHRKVPSSKRAIKMMIVCYVNFRKLKEIIKGNSLTFSKS